MDTVYRWKTAVITPEEVGLLDLLKENVQERDKLSWDIAVAKQEFNKTAVDLVEAFSCLPYEPHECHFGTAKGGDFPQHVIEEWESRPYQFDETPPKYHEYFKLADEYDRILREIKAKRKRRKQARGRSKTNPQRKAMK